MVDLTNIVGISGLFAILVAVSIFTMASNSWLAAITSKLFEMTTDNVLVGIEGEEEIYDEFYVPVMNNLRAERLRYIVSFYQLFMGFGYAVAIAILFFGSLLIIYWGGDAKFGNGGSLEIDLKGKTEFLKNLGVDVGQLIEIAPLACGLFCVILVIWACIIKLMYMRIYREDVQRVNVLD